MPPIILLLSCCFYCPRITPRLAVLRPTSFPKRRGVQVMPLFIFNCAQRLHGCCRALPISAGHREQTIACKLLGGFHGASNIPSDGEVYNPMAAIAQDWRTPAHCISATEDICCFRASLLGNGKQSHFKRRSHAPPSRRP